MRRSGMCIVAGLAAVGMSVTTAAADPLYDSLSQPVAQVSHDPALGPGLVDTVRFFQGIGPQHQFPMVNIWGSEYGAPAPEQNFTTPRLVGRVNEPEFGTERLLIESPAMRRVVEVEVLHPRDRSRPAPVLYLLDGVGSEKTSGWLRKANAHKSMADKHVTVVMPTDAHGSDYADWIARDPVLGYQKWETFLTQELPGVVEKEVNFDGRRFIGGVSMGGTAAARLANLHPDMYRGMFSISGCYSTRTPAGRAYHNMAPRSMGGNPDLMWGPGLETPERTRNDVLGNPAGIAGMPVYIYTGTGEATPEDVNESRESGIQSLASKVALEKFTHTCSVELENGLAQRGQLDARKKFVYQPYGVHRWGYFGQQLPLAWQHISQG